MNHLLVDWFYCLELVILSMAAFDALKRVWTSDILMLKLGVALSDNSMAI